MSPFRLVLFDFDGTLSLLREDWPQIMTALMVEELRAAGTAEPDADRVEDQIMRRNGLPTIHQMNWLADEVRRGGGSPHDPSAYQQRYDERLMARLRGRYADLKNGRATPSEWTVAGSHAFLDALHRRGVTLYLASGTALPHVRHEAELLGLARYFLPHVYAPRAGDREFTKGRLIEQALRENGLRGEELLAFGDGIVEIEEVKRVGGTAVAVASPPAGAPPGINAWKRDRLVRAGADLVIADYRQPAALLQLLFGPA